MRRTQKILIATLMTTLTACRSLASAPPVQTDPSKMSPVILAPKDKQRIGAEGDPLCSERDRPCHKIRAEGRIPTDLTPFFGVEPVLASPRIWIQPPIHGVKSDGSFSSLIYLGEAHNGAEQYFKIYLFACKDQDRFREGEELLQLPKDCQVGDPVEVYRER